MQPYDASFRMKLSCSRCRDRKLKCDRGKPQCKRCHAIGIQCTYPERRKTRGSRQKSEFHQLDHRLEALEERLKTAATPDHDPSTPTPATRGEEAPRGFAFKTGTHDEATPRNLELEPGTAKYVYQMVSGAKDSLETITSQCRLASNSESPWNQSTVNSAITRLDTALVQLAAPSPRLNGGPTTDAKSTLPIDDAKRYINTFLDTLLPCFSIFGAFSKAVDPDFMRAMPYIIDSPYAQVDPVMRVIYYCAIYLCQSIGTVEEQQLGIKTYYKCLQLAPKWLETATGTELDLFAASIIGWLAINNFDYHLAWQFHCEACRFGTILGIHNVDLGAPGPSQDESVKEDYRRLHWFLVEIDFLFRLWYDKPKALRCAEVTQVKLPKEISPATKQPKRIQCTLFIVWSRVLYIMDSFFEAIETVSGQKLSSRVDHCCNQLAELAEDWDLLSLGRSSAVSLEKSWLYAESVIAIHSFIIFMRRKASDTDRIPHPQAVEAARIVIRTIYEWSQRHVSPTKEHQGYNSHLVTFYPFCAFFTLYYHIMSSDDASECEEDICTLEKVVSIMSEIALIRPNFVPIANAMRALNDVSRAVHSRQQLPNLTVVGPAPRSQAYYDPVSSVDPQVPSQMPVFNPFESLQNLPADFPLQTPNDPSGGFGVPFQLQNQVAFDWGPASDTRPGTARTVSQPVDFVRAIESELIWRDWHESWWQGSSQGGASEVNLG
ncbi:uncharacterized protein BDV14DRAFT_205029 [Aspergillus stella-maris]|uniref:uncharacterized protein n=1 Tax=Aspergillus stella-maris TaxID=1810926 RepID=UPI003CCE2225